MPSESWYYFLSIESDLGYTARFVEPCEENDACYSVEFARLITAASSEIEVVLKTLLQSITNVPDRANINVLRNSFKSHYPKFHNMEIYIPRCRRFLKPWKEWAIDQNPGWWKAYNAVKHDRRNSFKEASLGNALNAVAGLFCLQLYVHHSEYQRGSLEPWCQLLSMQGHYETVVDGAGGILPDFVR